MIQRLANYNTHATDAFEKESRLLLVRIDETTLTLALVQKQTGEWDAAEVFAIRPTDWQNEMIATELKQKSTLTAFAGLPAKIFLSTLNAMPVPVALQKDAPLFAATQFGIINNEKQFSDKVNAEMLISFSVNTALYEIVSAIFPQAAWHSTLALLVKQVLAIQAKNMYPLLYLSVNEGQAEIALTQKGNLLLARSFCFATGADLLYHLLNSCRQMDVHTAEVFIKIQGRTDEAAPALQLLKTYFAHVDFLQAAYPSQQADFLQAPPHFFTGLMEKV